MKAVKIILAGLLAAGTVSAAVIPSASAANLTPSHQSVPYFEKADRHAGLVLNEPGGPVWVGSYSIIETINGKAVRVLADCMSPYKQLQTGGKTTIGTYGTAKQSAELNWIMTYKGNSSDNNTAAVAQVAMRTVLGKEVKGLDEPGGSNGWFVNAVKTDIADAQAYAGPDTGKITYTHLADNPGQPGSAVFSIYSATGHKINGVSSTFTAVNASVKADGKSGASQQFTRTGDHSKKITIAAKAPEPRSAVIIGNPENKYGQFLISSYSGSVVASATYGTGVQKVGSSVRCQCDGKNNATATVTQPAGTDTARYVAYVNGRKTASVTIAHSSKDQGRAIRLDAADGSKVAVTASYHVNGHWTTPEQLGGTFIIHCPVLPKVNLSFQCEASGYCINLSAVNTSKYTDYLYWTEGGKTGSVVVPAGKTVVKVLPSGNVSFHATVTSGGKVVNQTPVF
jgi:hypothetical protein